MQRALSSHAGWLLWLGAIGGQIERAWRPCQFCFPISQFLVQSGPLHPLPLPLGEIGILNRQLRKFRSGSASRERLVKDFQFVEKDRQRPAIGNRVVENDAKG